MTWLWILLVIIVCLAAVIFIAGGIIAKIIVHGDRSTVDASWNYVIENAPACSRFSQDQFSNYTLTGEDGYLYHVSCLPAKDPASNRYLVLCHGYTDTRWGMLRYIQFYHELNFHCIIFDQRGHGENVPGPCSYSVKEAKSLLLVLKDAQTRYPGEKIFGIHGESLGGATVLQSLKYDLSQYHVKFAVDDCGFCDIVPILKTGLKKEHHLPIMVYPASVMAKLMYGVSFTEARPIRSVYGNKLPLLICHGEEDDFIPVWHSEKVKEATAGYCEFHRFPGAGHAFSAFVSPDEYLKVLDSFITKVLETAE